MNIFRTASADSLSSTSSTGDLSFLPEQETHIGTRFTHPLSATRSITLTEDSSGGCGGKAWEAAELLSSYLKHRIERDEFGYETVLELGSGTGFVGLCLAALSSAKITITDLDIFVPLIQKNVELNLTKEEMERVEAEKLHWGDPLSSSIVGKLPFDLVLIADCVYLESLFDILVQTLVDLTFPTASTKETDLPATPKTEIWIAYKKRRKADKRFWTKLRKHFIIEELGGDWEEMERWRKGSLYLYRVVRK